MKVNKGEARLYGFNYVRDLNGKDNTFYTMSKYEQIETWLDGIGYIATQDPNPNSSAAYTHLQSDDIFLYTGHAEAARVTFCGVNNEKDKIEEIKGMILAHSNMTTNFPNLYYPNKYYINTLTDNQLAGARCVLYLGCRSGNSYTNSSGTYNLVDETFNKGAHFVLGTTEQITNVQTDTWLEYFFNLVSYGFDIYYCIENANNLLGDIEVNSTDSNGNQIVKIIDGLPLYRRGDEAQRLGV
jgi:hypothetical protein